MTAIADRHPAPTDPTATGDCPAAPAAAARAPFVEPRLRFVEPRLTPRGDLRKVTAGMFGGFSP